MILVAALASGCALRHRDVTSIAAARGHLAGSTVSVQGVVTVPAGLFASFTGEQGLAISDDTGGIYVSLPEPVRASLGDELRVTGRVASIAKLVTLSSRPESVEVLARRPPVAPEPMRTGAVGAATEGRLVRVAGAVTRPVADDRPYGYKIWIDDGSGEIQVFVPVSTGLDPRVEPAVRPGDHLAAAGLSARYEGTYEVVPRFAGDLAVSRP